MESIKICSVFCFLCFLCLCKAQEFANAKDINMQFINGVGPRGNTTLSLQLINNADSLVQKLIGQYETGHYHDLEDIKEYYYIVDEYQFYYQNYRTGRVSKPLFQKWIKENGWEIKDTLYLCSKPMSLVVRVLVGKKKNDGTYYYMVDREQNGTYDDDVLIPVLAKASNVNKGAEPSPVLLDFLSGGTLTEEPIHIELFFMNDRVSISFRTFLFARFSYRGVPYVICKDLLFANDVYLLPDVPYFSAIPRDLAIHDSEDVKIGEDAFKIFFQRWNTHITLIPQENREIGEFYVVSVPTANSHMVKVPYDNLEGEDILSNERRSLDEYKGKWVLLYFWSDACGPCIQSLPKLNSAQERYRKNGFEILGIMDVRSNALTQQILEENQVHWPNIRLSDVNLEGSVYQVHAYPTTYLINPEGLIETRYFSTNELERLLLSKLN